MVAVCMNYTVAGNFPTLLRFTTIRYHLQTTAKPAKFSLTATWTVT